MTTDLVIINSLIEAFLPVVSQIDEVHPLLGHLINALLDLLRAEVSTGNQLLAGLGDGQHVLVTGSHLILVRLSGNTWQLNTAV